MATADTDWVRIALDAAGWVASSLVGLVLGAWRGGRHSVHKEQEIKDDYNRKIEGLREEMRQSMSAYESKADDRNDLLVGQFRESFEGIRRQIDENRVSNEQRFLPRDEFREFRKEWRESTSELKAMIAAARQ
jgi:hypothetical protein